MRERLSTPIDVRIPSSVGSAEAAERLRDAISRGASIESAPTRLDRRLKGIINGDRIVLSVSNRRFVTGRWGWDIEFDGTVASRGNGSELVGQIDIPDRRNQRLIFAMLLIATSIGMVVWIANIYRESASLVSLIGPILGVAAFTLFLLVVAYRLESDGEKYASDDAVALTSFLEQLLA